MSRHSKPDFLDIINEYPWDNMQKHIVGDAIRQFVVNILDSTAEMLLLDGRTIEEAIAMLRASQDLISKKITEILNKNVRQDIAISSLQLAVTALQQAIEELKNITPEPGGSTLAFSDQFKKINEVVYLNLKFITANPPDIAESNVTPIINYEETNIIGWDESYISSSYNDETGEYRFEALKDWHHGAIDPVYSWFFPVSLLTDSEIDDFNNTTGSRHVFQMDVKVNSILYNGLNQPKFYWAIQYYWQGHKDIIAPLAPYVENEFSYGKKELTINDTLRSLRIAFFTSEINNYIPAGSVFILKNINFQKFA